MAVAITLLVLVGASLTLPQFNRNPGHLQPTGEGGPAPQSPRPPAPAPTVAPTIGRSSPGETTPAEPALQSTSRAGRSGEALWGFYIYMAADNSLSQEAQDDLNEMLQVGSRPGLLEIVTLTDYKTKPGWQDKADYRNGTTRAYHVLSRELEQTPLHRLDINWTDEVDMGRGESLSTFLNWALTAYPARNRVLVIWDHGNGWKKVAEDSGGSYLTMPEINEALARAGAEFSIIGFDACLMAMTEIAHALSPYTQMVIGSQAYEPSEGWTYDTMLGGLLADLESLSTPEVAQRLVYNYIESYRNGSVPSGYSVTYAALTSQGLLEVEAALADFADQLRLISRAYPAALEAARLATQTYEDPEYLDLYHLSQEVALRIPLPEVRAAAQRLQQALETAVVAEDHWRMPSKSAVGDSNGLSIYFPRSSVRTDYYDLSFTRDSPWVDFLKAFSQPESPGGVLALAQVTPLDRDQDGYAEALQWQTNYSLNDPGGRLRVQLLDGQMGLVASHNFSLNGTSGRLGGEPLVAPASGSYYLQFLLYSDDGYLAQALTHGPYELDLRLPDLAVTTLAVSYQNQPVRGLLVGDQVQLWAQVTNRGTITSAPALLNLTVAGEPLRSLELGPLDPGTAVVAQADWSPHDPGQAALKAQALTLEGLAEANPQDNLLTGRVEVFPRDPSPFAPDLTLTSVADFTFLADPAAFTPAVVQVRLTNPRAGPYDLVSLAASAPPDWQVDLPTEPLFLADGQSVTFNLTVAAPLRTVAGEYQLELTATARDGTLGPARTITLTLPGYAGVQLTAKLDRPFLEPAGEGEVEITVTNSGNQPAQLTLVKQLPPVIEGYLTDAYLELDPFQTNRTTLKLQVKPGLASGDYLLTLALQAPPTPPDTAGPQLVTLTLLLPVARPTTEEQPRPLPAPSAAAGLLALGLAGLIGRRRR